MVLKITTGLALSALWNIRDGWKVTVLLWNLTALAQSRAATPQVSTILYLQLERKPQCLGLVYALGLCLCERRGLCPGLMSCFRDNARRGVDMWFGRRFYAIFWSLFLITYFSVFFTHFFPSLLIYSVSRLTVTNSGTLPQYLHATGGANYYRLFSSSRKRPGYSCVPADHILSYR